MFRKFVLALGATAAIGAAALIPTAASAGGGGGHHHGHGHWRGGFALGLYAPTYISGPDCYIVKKLVMTDNGPRVRRYTVCD